MKFLNLILSLSIIFLIVAASPVQSATIHVPADQPIIQAGIDASVNGDSDVANILDLTYLLLNQNATKIAVASLTDGRTQDV